MLDHDDLLAPDALFEVVRCVNDNEKADVITVMKIKLLPTVQEDLNLILKRILILNC